MQSRFLNFLSGFATVMNRWRLFPRIFTLLFGYLMYIVVMWFMGLSTPTTEQTAFVTAFVAGAAAFFKFYVGSGPNTNTKTDEDE